MGGQILKVLTAEVGNKSVMSKGKATPLSATMVGNFNTYLSVIDIDGTFGWKI